MSETPSTSSEKNPLVAVVGIVGRTNAGKSTLVNRLVGEKISIVSPVEQTTRNTVRGIVADSRGQLVLLDTPGLHKAQGHLGTLLNRMARRSAAGVDILCVVFDAAEEPQMEDEGWMSRVAKERPSKVVFVLNKADKKPFFETMYHEAWEEALKTTPVEGADAALPVPEPIWVKAIASTEGGENAARDALFSLAEPGDLLFPEDVVTDYPRRFTIADIIREKFISRMYREIPHELGICVKSIEETEKRWKVNVDVLVNRESQAGIVIGKGGSIIKSVREEAERELRQIYELKVSLKMQVKEERNWMENKRILAEMGYLGGEI